MHSHQGSITSPNWPSHYPSNTECTWKLNVNPGYHIEATFLVPFELSQLDLGRCLADFVEVCFFIYINITLNKGTIKKTIPRSKWIILRGIKTNQILMSALFFFKILTIQKRKNVLFN